MELVAEAAGLTRQALYHHFESKDALFRAVISGVYEASLDAEDEAAREQEEAGATLGDILAARATAGMRRALDVVSSSAYAQELLSEHNVQGLEAHRTYVELYDRRRVDAIRQIIRRDHLVLRTGVTPAILSRLVKLGIEGAKASRPQVSLDALLADVALIVRTIVAGAIMPIGSGATKATSKARDRTRKRPT